MNDQIPPLKPRPARRGGTPRVMTAEERVAATQAIDAIEVRTRARAQGLRRLSYLLLTAIIVLLVGGLGVLFYSQILLITNSTEQTNEIKKKQDQIDQEQRDLDKLATDFARLRQDVAAAANAAVPPTVLAFNTLRSVQFAADGKRGWAVGGNATILTTRDGGDTWQSQTSGTTNDLLSVQFAADGKRGWAVGGNGTILTTRDGGDTWQSQTAARRMVSGPCSSPPTASAAGRWATMARSCGSIRRI